MTVISTSAASFHDPSQQDHFATIRGRIYAWIKGHPGGWTIGEIACLLRLEKSTVSARINEMLWTGELTESDHRKDCFSGRMARPVRVAE